jgi:tRNA dimethylallyltransferase
MVTSGAADEALKADEGGIARTARAAIGFEQLLEGDVERMKSAQRAFARRQLTWMRRMPGVELIDRTGESDEAVAMSVLALLDGAQSGERNGA